MTTTLIRPPKTMLEIWESLPEGTLCQLINNKLIMSPAPLDIHQQILGFIFLEVGSYLKKNNLGEIRVAPYDVRFSKQNIFQPDIIFIKNENLNKIDRTGLKGAPDLVIEILSPSTGHLDYVEKKNIYEKYGVKEYFIVDPENKKVDTFILKNNLFEQQKGVVGKIKSKILGTTISF
jgi:Uma2 family endonuclease